MDLTGDPPGSVLQKKQGAVKGAGPVIPGGGSIKSGPRERSAFCALERGGGYFLKLSFRLTLRLNTRWPGRESLLSRQK